MSIIPISPLPFPSPPYSPPPTRPRIYNSPSSPPRCHGSYFLFSVLSLARLCILPWLPFSAIPSANALYYVLGARVHGGRYLFSMSPAVVVVLWVVAEVGVGAFDVILVP